MHVVVEADGGSRGNPGPAGYGAVVLAADTRAVLAERNGGIGVATNNVAEYTGLIEGLRAAAELGARRVDVRMDSKLVVEQVSGRWKVKHPGLRPLAEEARALAAQFDDVDFQWIPRAENAHADRLANEAMDEQASPSERPAPAQWTGARGTPTRLYLLRHGQTELSVDRRYSGRRDVPLTATGQAQAAAAGKRLAALLGPDPVAVVSSPLGRARATADAVADALGDRAADVVEHAGLLETDFGQWEGLTFAEAAARDAELHRSWLSDTSVPAPGGESFDVVHGRVLRARDELLSDYAGRTVVVVSHVTPIKSLLRMALAAGPQLLFRLHLDLASLSVVEFYPDGNASVRLVNDTAHLE